MKRGQAALEYLFTYGWAFLAILITIGALAYFGVFDLNNLRSDSCEFPPGLICEEFALSNDIDAQPHLYVELLNTYGVDLNVTAFNITSSFTDTIACETDTQIIDEDIGILLEHENTTLFECEIPQEQYLEGQTYSFVAYIQFSQTGHTYVHNTTGAVLATAQ